MSNVTIHTVKNGFTIHHSYSADGKMHQDTYVAKNQTELVKLVKVCTKVKRVVKPKKAKAPKAAEKTDA